MKHLMIFERFYKPSMDIKKRLDELVDKLKEKFGGGIQFFEALDDKIKSIANEDMLIDLTKGSKTEWIATSGGFGDSIYKLYEEGKIECRGVIVFNGKMLTNNLGVESWYPANIEIDNKKFVYVDDSYFSGGTVKKINNFLKSKNSLIKRVFVIYDGSRKKKKLIKSYFRYFV